MELDWHLFGLAVELQLDPDLDPLILSPAWRGLKLVELTTATVMCTTSFTLDSVRAFQFRRVVVCLATRTLLLAAFLRSVVIFVKYREVPTRTVLPNFIGNCRDSVIFAFWRPQQRRS
jgi:hypothetical protein